MEGRDNAIAIVAVVAVVALLAFLGFVFVQQRRDNGGVMSVNPQANGGFVIIDRPS